MRTRDVKKKFKENFDQFLNSINTKENYETIKEKIYIDNKDSLVCNWLLKRKYNRFWKTAFLCLLVTVCFFVTLYFYEKVERADIHDEDEIIEFLKENTNSYYSDPILEVHSLDDCELDVYIGKVYDNGIYVLKYFYFFHPSDDKERIDEQIEFHNLTTNEKEVIILTDLHGSINNYIAINENDYISCSIVHRSSITEQVFIANEEVFLHLVE